MRSLRKTGSARANVLGSQKPRAQTREEPAGALGCGRAGGGRQRREEWSQAPRLGLLSGRSLGTLGHRRGGCQPALPPPLRPAGSLRNPKRGQAPCQGEGCQARPGRQLPTQMVPMCWSWPDSLPANSHGDGVAATAGSGAGVRAGEGGGRGRGAPRCPGRCWDSRRRAWGAFPGGGVASGRTRPSLTGAGILGGAPPWPRP